MKVRTISTNSLHLEPENLPNILQDRMDRVTDEISRICLEGTHTKSSKKITNTKGTINYSGWNIANESEDGQIDPFEGDKDLITTEVFKEE